MWQPGMTLASIEKEAINEALKFYQGNKTQAANALGIAIKTLYNKLDVYAEEDLKEKSALEALRMKEKEQLEKFRGVNHANTGEETESGVDLQSASEISEKQSLPLREQKKVQEMPPARVAGTRQRGNS